MIYNWRLDKKLGSSRFQKPGGHLGIRTVRGAGGMSACKTHSMSLLKTFTKTRGLCSRENTSLFCTQQIKVDSEKVQFD